MSSGPSSKLFVGGLSWGTDDNALREAFSSFGEVIDAKVVMDRETGRSKGFGFVSFTSTADAESALQSMDGRALGGRMLRVNFAIEKPPSARGFGGGGGFGFGSPREDSSFGDSSFSGSSTSFGQNDSFNNSSFDSDSFGKNSFGGNSFGNDSFGSGTVSRDNIGSDFAGTDSFGSDSFGNRQDDFDASEGFAQSH